MIEPRAWMHEGEVYPVKQCRLLSMPIGEEYPNQTPLVTVADVLAALRQPSEAMMYAGGAANGGMPSDLELAVKAFLAMLDQFEKEQSSPAKKAYEAANPLGGPARMFDAIADRIRAGEDYHSVLADYGVTVEAK